MKPKDKIRGRTGSEAKKSNQNEVYKVIKNFSNLYLRIQIKDGTWFALQIFKIQFSSKCRDFTDEIH